MQRIKVSGIPIQTVAVNTSDTSQTLSDMGVTIVHATSPRLEQAQYVIISVESNPIRVVPAGTASTTVGHLFQVGESFRLEEQEIKLAEFISANAGSAATLQVTVEY